MFARRPKKSSQDPFALLAGLVDPRPIVDAELDRAKRELLAMAEQDMTLREKITFRYRLWQLHRKYRDLGDWQARW